MGLDLKLPPLLPPSGVAAGAPFSPQLPLAPLLLLPLQELEERGVQPELYPYGSRGPVGAHYLAAKHGVRWGDLGDDE